MLLQAFHCNLKTTKIILFKIFWVLLQQIESRDKNRFTSLYRRLYLRVPYNFEVRDLNDRVISLVNTD